MKKTALPLLAALLLPALAWAGPASLKPLKGITHLQHADQTTWEEVKGPVTVVEGDRIKTDGESTAFLTLPDDHRVAIGPDSFLTLQRMAAGQTKIFLKSGLVRNKIRKLKVAEDQFYKLQTPTAVCAVRGTDFAVTQPLAGSAQVRVFEGMVDLNSLRADIAHEVTHLQAGQATTVEVSGQVIEPPPAPPLPPQTGPAPGTPGAPPAWYDQPENIDFRSDMNGEAPKEKDGKGPKGPPPPPPPPPGAQPPQNPPGTPMAQPPQLDPFGRPLMPGFGLDPNGNPLNGGPGAFLPLVPPVGNQSPNPTQVGLDALVDTLRNQNLYDQANSLLVADLFQRNEVRMDPLTGQLRQYADAILKQGADSIKFVNANMLPGRPDTLNTMTAITRFNTALPALYTDATKSAFYADAGMPTYWATDYNLEISNTVDKLQVIANQGAPVVDSLLSRYVTKFDYVSTRINGTELWHINGANSFYLGGSRPNTTSHSLGGADHEIVNHYSTGDFYAVRTTFSDGNGHIVNAGDRPSGMTPSEFLNSLYTRTTIRSNLLSRGHLDIYGSVQARTLAGLYSINDAEAMGILNSNMSPPTAPLGLAL